MSQNLAMSEFEPSANVIELPLERVRETAPESVAPSPEVRSKSAKELAVEYGVSDRTVNTWFKTVAAAYCWMEVEALKTGKSAKTRYTPLFQTLLADLSRRCRQSIGSRLDCLSSRRQSQQASCRSRCTQICQR